MARTNIVTLFDNIPGGIFWAELDDKQKAAIRLSLGLGRIVQIKFPEIADDYRRGMTQDEILEKYNIRQIFSLTNINTARMVISSALRGYDGRMSQVTNVAPYPGLIADSAELVVLAKDHRVAGIIKQMDDQKGIHGQTGEDHKRIGRLGAKAIGGNPFTDEEEALVQELAADLTYRRKSRINAQKIAAQINASLHNGAEVRNARQIRKVYCRMKKKLRRR